MTVHIGAKPGQIAETVLMPGDPYRAKWAAQTFLEGAELVNEVRGMLGFTGTYKGNRVTIQGSGMGMPSLSIYANELIRDYNAQTAPITDCWRLRSKRPRRAEPRRMWAASIRQMFSMLNAPIWTNRWCATGYWASRWKRPSCTHWPRGTAVGRWRY